MSTKIGKVYKIITQESNECYVGSTFSTLTKRLYHHKSQYKNHKNGNKKYCSSFNMFDKYGIEKCKIVLIKEYECLNRRQLLNYEQLWIKKLKSVNRLNTATYFMSKRLKKIMDKKYNEENKDKIKLWQKKYTENNKEKIYTYRKKYYNENYDKLKEYRKNYYKKNKNIILNQQKKYVEKNKEKRDAYHKKYRESNKYKINEKLKQKITCECSSVVSKRNFSAHKKSNKHIKYVKANS